MLDRTRPRSPTAETAVLNTAQCGFDPHRGHVRSLMVVLGCAVALGACSSGSPSPPTRQPSPSPSSSGPALVAKTFLGVRVLVPTGWHTDRQASTRTDGHATFTAPDRRGRVYLEVNDCAACVDEGDVSRAQRNNVPDPGAVIAQYSPVTKHRRDVASIAFTIRVPDGYVSSALLTVRKVHGEITGYVVVEATFPFADAGVARQVVASLRGQGIVS